jgi:nitronate monooxygenase
VTEAKWAAKGRDGGVDGFIAVNRRAGGHAGPRDVRALFEELAPLGLPVVCAGGVGDGRGFVEALDIGYAGVQLGTRFIATPECRASDAYKQAIVRAGEDEVVLTERLTGIPVSVLNTPYVQRIGLRSNPLARWLLRNRRTRYFMRSLYALRAGWMLKRTSLDESRSDYWQAGMSVAGIDAIEPAGAIVRRLAEAAMG